MSSKALEDSLDGLALTSFGVMDTTLEEVFLKVSEEDQSLENSDAGQTPPLHLLLQLLSSQLTCFFSASCARLKGSPGGSRVGKSTVGSPGPGPPQAETRPCAEDEKPEVELSDLARSCELSQSQSSLRSSSSVGSVRGDEFGFFADFYGEYCPLSDEDQEDESASLGGKTGAACVHHSPRQDPPAASEPRSTNLGPKTCPAKLF